MATAAATRRRVDHNPVPTANTAVTTRRRAPIRIIAGLLVIALGFVIGALVAAGVNKAVDVLALARSVPAGAVLSDADLTIMRIVPDVNLHVLTAARRGEVIGQTAAVPMRAGSLLTTEQLGAVTDPGPGQSILAMGVKNGRAPASLAAGASVLVLVVANSPGGQAPATVQAPAVVRDVQAPDTSGLTVVTLQMASPDAVRVASAGGDVTIVVQGR